MVRAILGLALGLALASPALAVHVGSWDNGWDDASAASAWRGGWLGGSHAGGSSGWGFGWRGLKSEAYFEGKFEGIMSEYDAGLEEIEDYYQSDDYDDVLTDLQRLLDKHDWYLDGVQGSVERIDMLVDWTNDKIARLEDKLADLDDEDAPRWKAWTSRWLEHSLERVESRLDLLTEKQAGAEDKLLTVQAFNDELAMYLDDVTMAGQGTVSEGLIMSAGLSADIATFITPDYPASAAEASAPQLLTAATTTAAPEPAAAIAAAALGLLGFARRRRRQEPGCGGAVV